MSSCTCGRKLYEGLTQEGCPVHDSAALAGAQRGWVEPAPRYDDVYHEGTAALDAEAEGRVPHEIHEASDEYPSAPPPAPARRIIDGKFHVEGSQIIKTASGEVVPEEEATVLMRGRDRLVLPTLKHYRELCRVDGCNDYQLGLVDELIARFEEYARTHPTKQPGITRGAPWVPPPAPANPLRVSNGSTGEATFDLIAHLGRQRAWSEATFGPGCRTDGVLDHITKEVAEVRKAPLDLEEWVDLILLALDGAWRAGHSPIAIAYLLGWKLDKNTKREWPDWRTAEAGKAIEHVRPAEVEAEPQMTDNVNHPSHYNAHPSGIECIQVVEHMGFCLGNAVKYIWRADMKGGVEDLKKAIWYLEREVARREEK